VSPLVGQQEGYPVSKNPYQLSKKLPFRDPGPTRKKTVKQKLKAT